MSSFSSCLDLPSAGITHLYYDAQHRHHISEGYFLVLTHHNVQRSGVQDDITMPCVMSVQICHLRHPSCLHVSNIQKSFLLTWNIFFSATHSYPNKLHNIRSCSFYPVTSLHALCVSFLHFPLPSSTSLFYYTIFWTWEQICSCRIRRSTMPCCPTHASAVSAAHVLCSTAPLHNPVSLIGHAWEI